MTEFPTNAFAVLFEYNFGNGPLFESQSDLVDQLLNDPDSQYYTLATAREVYDKNRIRLKTYISQLFSTDAKRNITKEFKQSLLVLLQKKLPSNYSADVIVYEIVKDLVRINPGRVYSPTSKAQVQDWTAYNEHIELWIKTIIFENSETEDPYKLGQANGVRQGAMLIWNMLYPKNKGE